MKIILSLLSTALLALSAFADSIAQPIATDSALKITRQVEPVYPLEARALGWEGSVVVECLVAPDGTVIAAGAVEKSGHKKFDDAAIEAVSKWRFNARGGSQNPRLVKVPIHFNLVQPAAGMDTTTIASR